MSTQKKSTKATKATKAIKTTIVVNVSESHIRRGVNHHSGNCPIALALRSMRYKAVEVWNDGVFVHRGKTMFYADLPIRAQKFIKKFDDGDKSVKPFSFRIPLSEVR